MSLKNKRKFFDDHLEFWKNIGFGADERKRINRMLRRAGVRKGMTVFEPGCGAGRLTSILAKKVGPEGRVIAADIAPKLVRAARQAAPERHVEVRCCAAETIRLPARSVDVIVCFNLFPHLDRKEAALDKFRKILREDGVLVIYHLISRRRINEMHRSIGGAVKGDLMPPAPTMRRMCRAAGFRVEELTDGREGYLLVARPAEIPAGRSY